MSTSALDTVVSKIQLHSKMKFLEEPHPGKVLWGGRDGIKSWGMAQALIIAGTKRPERILCARETQESMADSVQKLLKDRIEEMRLENFYEVLATTIRSAEIPCLACTIKNTQKCKKCQGKRSLGLTEFLFHGIKANVKKIKSMERITKAWLEEAENVSNESWDVILPTIRAEGSEIWVSFNPKLESDATYQRCVVNPEPGWEVVHTGYTDNRWLSETSRVRIEHMRTTDPRGFKHIYGGQPVNAAEGAIFEVELENALNEGRIGDFPYDRTKPVDAVYDLGFGDPTAIWFVQIYDGKLTFIDYYEDNHHDITHHVLEVQKRPYVVREHIVPHDAVDSIIHGRLRGVSDKSMSIIDIMKDIGCSVRSAPKLLKNDVLNAARTKFPTCRFNKETCQLGIDRLRLYQWDRKPDEEGKRKPLHDASSHGSDAFMGACLSVKPGRAPDVEPQRPPAKLPRGPQGWMAGL